MKRSIIALAAVGTAMLLPAGMCLAQNDSGAAKPDSVNVTVEVQNTESTGASVTVTTEKGGTDSTVTVSINSGGRREQRARRRMSWIVGVKAGALSYLPGSLFVQKRIGTKVLLGCAFEYDRNPSNLYLPDLGSGNSDNVSEYYRSSNTYSSWSVRLAPECLMPVLRHRQYRVLAGVAIDLQYGQARGSRSDATYYPFNDTSWVTVAGHGKENRYSAYLPVVIERDFRIRKQVFSVGIESSLAAVSYDKQIGESDVTSRQGARPAETSHRRSSSAYPLRLSLRNPFQNTVSLLLKWYI
jgi:hypothetical protein